MEFLRKQAHRDGGYHERENDGQQPEEVPEVGLVEQKKRGKEEPARHQQEDRDDDVGDGRGEIRVEFFAADAQGVAHISPPS